MVNLTQLFALATLGSSTISAIHIDIRRYADNNCNESKFIRKETDMHDTTCKTFSSNELAFNSYKFMVTKGHKDMEKKDCQIVAYKDSHCHGESHTFGDLAGMNSQCGVLPSGFEGRSIRLECHKKPKAAVTVTSLVASKPAPQIKAVTSTKKAVTVTESPTVTVTQAQTTTKKEETTLTLVPKKHVQHCHYDDDDWKEV